MVHSSNQHLHMTGASVLERDPGTTVHCRTPFPWRSATSYPQNEKPRQWSHLGVARGYLRGQHQGCWVRAHLCGVRQLASHKTLLTRYSNVHTYIKSVWLLASTWLSGWVYSLMLISKETMFLNSKDNSISSNYAKCGDSHLTKNVQKKICSLINQYLIKRNDKSSINEKICLPSEFIALSGLWHTLYCFYCGYFTACY